MTDPNQITRDVQDAADAPEGVSVFVVTPDEAIARAVAPTLARTLYPGDTYSDEILYCEWQPDQTISGFEVVVRVRRGGVR